MKLPFTNSYLSKACSGIALSVLCAGTLVGCSGATAPESSAPASASSVPTPNPYIEVAIAGEAASGWSTSLPGRIAFSPLGVSALTSPVSGRVLAIETRPGVRVKAGDALLTLQSAEAASARAELAEAEAKSVSAQDLLRRQNQLLSKGVGLEVERFEAEIALREANAELERAKRMSALIGSGVGDRYTLRAPASGVVMSLKATVGAAVSPDGEPLAEIGDGAALWAQADVAESGLRDVQEGAAAQVRVAATGELLDAVVDGIGRRVDGEQRRVSVYLKLDHPPADLVPGMYAEVKLAQSTQNATLRLPVAAVLIKNGRDRIVYVQNAEGHYEKRAVLTGVSHDGQVAILEGLKPGEKVVVRGALLLDADSEQLL